MKSSIFSIQVTLVLFLFFTIFNQNANSQTSTKQDPKISIVGNYVGSNYKGNFVWCGVMNLAWNELSENILKEKLKLNSQDKTALEMIEKLNNPIFSKNDLDENSYYIKSGFGQKTINAINQESKVKFPNKSFKDLKIELEDDGLVSYAYFNKAVAYLYEFNTSTVTFKGKEVKGFAYNPKVTEQLYNIEIVDYTNDDKFIIKLRLKNENNQDDELILAKGYAMYNPDVVIKIINASNPEEYHSLDKRDQFEAPKLNLNFHREYKEMMNQLLKHKGFEKTFFSQMFENLKFNMDEMGATVEAEAVIAIESGGSSNSGKFIQRNFILNKPYWVIMQRKDSKNPYFILGINNTALMEKVN
ncbi:MAG: hypothetical protein RLZZ540_3536 [Bacteroidota bacterium]|jgi:hypothetical protein